MVQLRMALRSLASTPLVTIVAIVSLAFGMGANAAIFSIFEQVLLRPLSVEEPGRLVNLLNPGPKSGSNSSNTAGGSSSIFSYPMIRDLQEAPEADGNVDGIAAHRSFGANLGHDGLTLSGSGMLVSGNYFDVLGLTPSSGRTIREDDDETIGAHPVVMLSHAYWLSRFNGDPTVLNETLTVNGTPMTIIGVGPPGFRGTTMGNEADVFVPITMRGVVVPGWEGFENRRSYWVYAFARLSPGVQQETALAALNTRYQAIIRDVELELQSGGSESYLERFEAKALEMEPGWRGQSSLQTGSTGALSLLLGVTAFVLLIACANIANLLLTKAADRSSEIAIQLALGARRTHLVAQLMLESLLLSIGGALLGFIVSLATLHSILSLMPAEAVADFDLSVGRTTALFLAVLALLTSLIGLVPALQATRADLSSTMKAQSGKASSGRRASRIRTIMATAQIALSMTLLVCAGLFVTSLLNINRVDLGIDQDDLVTFSLSPELNGYSDEDSRALFERVEQRVAAIPGVAKVTAAFVPIIAGDNWNNNVSVQGFDSGPDVDAVSSFNAVGAGHFSTVGMALLAGREFAPTDARGTPKVAIVNEAFVKKFGLEDGAVGKRMEIGQSDELSIEIVGVVEDAKYSDVKRVAPPVYYLPYRQEESVGAMFFYARSSVAPESLLETVRNVVRELDPALPIDDLKTMALQIHESLFVDRLLSIISAAFALLATLLAAIGLYGVLAYSVSQREQELGLRMALGADRGAVQRLVMRQVGLMTLVGAVLGAIAAVALGRFASSLLFELEGSDPTILLVAAIVLGAVALAAGFAPARRASRIDPMRALRAE